MVVFSFAVRSSRRVRLDGSPAAGEGFDIIAIDRCADIDSIPYPLATREDLDETAELVKSCGRRVVTAVADVRNLTDLQACIDAGIEELGELDGRR